MYPGTALTRFRLYSTILILSTIVIGTIDFWKTINNNSLQGEQLPVCSHISHLRVAVVAEKFDDLVGGDTFIEGLEDRLVGDVHYDARGETLLGLGEHCQHSGLQFRT